MYIDDSCDMALRGTMKKQNKMSATTSLSTKQRMLFMIPTVSNYSTKDILKMKPDTSCWAFRTKDAFFLFPSLRSAVTRRVSFMRVSPSANGESSMKKTAKKIHTEFQPTSKPRV